jgi:hypothetical protein
MNPCQIRSYDIQSFELSCNDNDVLQYDILSEHGPRGGRSTIHDTRYMLARARDARYAYVAACVVTSDCCVVVALHGVIVGCVTTGVVASKRWRVVARVVLSRDGGGGGELPAIVYAILKLVCTASTPCT